MDRRKIRNRPHSSVHPDIASGIAEAKEDLKVRRRPTEGYPCIADGSRCSGQRCVAGSYIYRLLNGCPMNKLQDYARGGRWATVEAIISLIERKSHE